MHEVDQGLAEGRESNLRDQTVKIPWVRDGALDVWMAAYGPKALELAGREAPTASSCSSPTPSSSTGRSRWPARPRTAAGRDPDDLNVCVAAPAYVGEDLAHQRDQMPLVRRHGGQPRRRHRRDATATTPRSCPSALTDYIKARKGYDYSPPRQGGQPRR